MIKCIDKINDFIFRHLQAKDTEEELKQAGKNYFWLSNEHGKLSKENDELRVANSELRDWLLRKVRENEELRKENDELKERIENTLEKAAEGLLDKMEQLKNEITETSGGE